jgi:serine/threonine protein kinase
MAQIHERSVIHRGLKPADVLFDANWEIRIGGFEWARITRTADFFSMSWPGPYVRDIDEMLLPDFRPFTAPELFDDDDRYSYPVDVYAFGVLLYQFFTDQQVFEGMKSPPRSAQQLMRAVRRGQRFKRPIGVPDPFWNLITRCWAHDPSHRPTFEEIVKFMLESNDFTFPGTDRERYNEYRQRMTQTVAQRLRKLELEMLLREEMLRPWKEVASQGIALSCPSSMA